MTKSEETNDWNLWLKKEKKRLRTIEIVNDGKFLLFNIASELNLNKMIFLKSVGIELVPSL